MQPTRKAIHGKGKAVLRASGGEATFTELSYHYPLKLLSPQATAQDVPLGIAYILSYGGGLVSGDRVELEVDVGSDAILLLLTQGSTKVFKSRAIADQSRASNSLISNTGSLSGTTTQRLITQIASHGFLLLLPDPVTCFATASYSQTQSFRLSPDGSSSLVLLDWFTSGRMALGEEWAFEKYRSVNEIWIGGRRVARDVMLLEDSSSSLSSTVSVPLPPRSLKDRLAPYACYATLFLFGPHTQRTISSLTTVYESISQMQAPEPDSLIWSMSPLEGAQGSIVRVAGKETEGVRDWLRKALVDLKDIIGVDAYRTAFI